MHANQLSTDLMPTLTLRDVPDALHVWLKQQAGANRRSLNQEVICRLDGLRNGPAENLPAHERLQRIRAIARRSAALTVLDARPEAEVLGLGPDGLPR